MATADFNKDGKPDLVLGHNDFGEVSVLLGNGVGNFSLGSYATGNDPRRVAVGDFNEDTWPDIITANEFTQSVTILTNLSGTGFSRQDYLFFTAYYQDIRVADFNGDNHLDFAAAGVTSGGAQNFVRIGLGDGAGNFNVDTYEVGIVAKRLVVGNFDSSPGLDIITTRYDWSNELSLLSGNGDGTFQPYTSFGNIAYGRDVDTMDINQDGIMDLVVASLSAIYWMPGISGGGFGAQQLLLTADYSTVALADFNNDGIKDLAYTDYTNSAVGIMKGLGGANYAPATFLPAGSQPTWIIAQDFNGDAKPDIVVDGGGYQFVSFFGNISY